MCVGGDLLSSARFCLGVFFLSLFCVRNASYSALKFQIQQKQQQAEQDTGLLHSNAALLTGSTLTHAQARFQIIARTPFALRHNYATSLVLQSHTHRSDLARPILLFIGRSLSRLPAHPSISSLDRAIIVAPCTRALVRDSVWLHRSSSASHPIRAHHHHRHHQALAGTSSASACATDSSASSVSSSAVLLSSTLATVGVAATLGAPLPGHPTAVAAPPL